MGRSLVTSIPLRTANPAADNHIIFVAMKTLRRYQHGGAPPHSATEMTDEQRAMDYLTRMYRGMYADAGQGAEAERRRVKRADPMGVRQDKGPFRSRDATPMDELQQIFSGITSFLKGDGYKRGDNDEYLRQLTEEAQGVFDRYHRANPDKPFGHLSSRR